MKPEKEKKVKEVVLWLGRKGVGVEAMQSVVVRPPIEKLNEGEKEWDIAPYYHSSIQILEKI